MLHLVNIESSKTLQFYYEDTARQMDMVRENWFPGQHLHKVRVKCNLQSAILQSSFGHDVWYRRFPTVKIGETSRTFNGTEN